MTEQDDALYEPTVRPEIFRPILKKIAQGRGSIAAEWRAIGPDEEKMKIFWDNVDYLQQHKFIKVGFTRLHGHRVLNNAAITAAGIDYLSEDGGITKQLNVVTVEISPASIKAILEANVDKSDKTAEEKSALRKQIAAISDEGMKRVADGLLSFGASHIPDLASFLGNILRSL